MQVRAASSQLARRIHPHTVRAADDAHQLAFRQYSAASNASALRDVLHTLNRFLGHLRYQALLFRFLFWIEKPEG